MRDGGTVTPVENFQGGSTPSMPVAALMLYLAASFLLPAPRPHPRAEREVTVVADDYRFTMPDTLVAGPTEFRLENHGRELHHLLLVRLLDGKTGADLVNAFKAGGPLPTWAVFAGGPNGVDPNGKALETTVPLEPGHYAAMCMIPGRDGVPHVMKGMIKDVVVKPGATTVTLTGKPDVTVALFDYGFMTSAPVTARTHRVIVTNSGVQPHEMELAQLLPGKTMADLAAWATKMDGPPPARFIGGVSPLAPGRRNVIELDLKRGHYAMLCFFPDVKDGKPHLEHGMVHDFVIP